MRPGEIIGGGEPIVLNPDLPVTRIAVTNTGDTPVHLTAHYHIFEANPRLRFDRLRAWGMRLDLPSNGSVRIAPGETRNVDLVPFGGNRVVRGFNGAVNGALDDIDPRVALQELIERSFLHEEA